MKSIGTKGKTVGNYLHRPPPPYFFTYFAAAKFVTKTEDVNNWKILQQCLFFSHQILLLPEAFPALGIKECCGSGSSFSKKV
jgi:hypothetical protein